MIYNNMLSPQSTCGEKTFFRQGLATPILLTSPCFAQLDQGYRSTSPQLEKPESVDFTKQLKKQIQNPSASQVEMTSAPYEAPAKDIKHMKPSKSFNHNFQKHTVITIKKLGKKMCQNLGFSPEEEVARQIWTIFESSGITSKKILVAMFGQASHETSKNRELFKSCYMGDLCNQDEEKVRKAQKILRLRLLELTEGDVVNSHIFRSRKISQRDQFIAYFNEFLQMLKLGPLTKFRINAQSTHHIEQVIKERKKQRSEVKSQMEIEYKTH